MSGEFEGESGREGGTPAEECDGGWTRATPGDCEDAALVDRRVLGDLSADEALALRAHAAACLRCAARLEEASALERLLVGSFRDVGARIRSPRAAVLAAIARGEVAGPLARTLGDPGAALPRARPARAGRRVRLFLAVNALAAGFLLAAFLGYVYLSLVTIKRQALTSQARVEVRNLAILLRERARARQAAPPAAPAPVMPDARDLEGALATLGLDRDPFGRPFVLDRAGPAPRLYSLGANGRDDHGAGDDIVAVLR